MARDDESFVVTVSQGLYKLLGDEIGLCNCTQAAFVRHCIAKELAARSRQRGYSAAYGAEQTPAETMAAELAV